MDVAPFPSDAFFAALFAAELRLTVSIIAGLAAGETILALGVVERLFFPVIPLLARWGINGKIAMAMLMSIGSSRSAAAVISGSYADGELTREEATYGTLSLAFPGYLRRWVGTAAISVGIAGHAGLIFALVILFRTICRFIWVVALLLRRGTGLAEVYDAGATKKISARERARRALRLLTRSLPWAWLFFAVTYGLVPFIDKAFSEYVARWGLYRILPAEGWAVAVSSLAHVQAGLASAAGALKTGSMSVWQAVLALLIGNMVGSVTRMMRQNVGFWVGIFPKDLVPALLRWHMITTFTLEALSILLVWCVSEVISAG